jgi:hypothetical protein
VNAEFQWWLLILGIVIGGALVYLVLADVQGDAEPDDLADQPDPGPTDDQAGEAHAGDEPFGTDAYGDDEPRDDRAASGGSSAGATL